MKTLVFDKQSLKNNLAVIRDKAGSTVIYGVLTGDAMGAGIVELAQFLRAEGIARFAVSEVTDAVTLRKAGMVEAEILMLRATTLREELEELMDLNVVCTVNSVESGMALNSVAESRATVAEAHIRVDTGMGFGGFLTENMEKIMGLYRNLPNVAISGIYTQIYAGKGKGQDAQAQIEEFCRAVGEIGRAGLETGMVHAADSFAFLHSDFTGVGGVRIGSALLGRCRRTRSDGLQKVGYGEVDIVETRWIPKGYTIGNELHMKTKRPTRVATLCVGYQNGFGVARSRPVGVLASLRQWWGKRHLSVRIGGQKAKLIGGIGATEILVDVTELKCSVGDVAVFDINPLYAKGFKREYRTRNVPEGGKK